jgi:hypothetical protein
MDSTSLNALAKEMRSLVFASRASNLATWRLLVPAIPCRFAPDALKATRPVVEPLERRVAQGLDAGPDRAGLVAGAQAPDRPDSRNNQVEPTG